MKRGLFETAKRRTMKMHCKFWSSMQCNELFSFRQMVWGLSSERGSLPLIKPWEALGTNAPLIPLLL